LKKYLLTFGLLGTLIFLGFFIYFYKTSGKFRQSIIAAVAAIVISTSSIAPTRAAGEADAFSNQQPHQQSRPAPRSGSGFFSGKPSNDGSGSGPGKPDDSGSDLSTDGLPQFPQVEPVEKTEKRVDKIDDHLRQMNEVSDSDTETENEFQSDRYNSKKKKKREAEQCKLDEKIEIVYRINENPALVREAERMGKDQAAQKDVNNLIEQLALGNDNPGIGNRRVKSLKNVSEARGRNEGRVYFRKKDGKLEILGKSNKDNQKKVIGILQKMGY
jgi:hypothetical protein